MKYHIFKYLACDITCEDDDDILNKTNSYQGIYGTIRKELKVKTIRDPRIQFYKLMAVPSCTKIRWFEEKTIDRYDKSMKSVTFRPHQEWRYKTRTQSKWQI